MALFDAARPHARQHARPQRTLTNRSPRRMLGVATTAIGVLASVIMGTAVPAAALVPQSVDSGVWQVNGRVRAIVQTGTTIYLGGQFTSLIGPGGQSVARTNLAALSATTGAPLAFAPNPNKQVFAIEVSEDEQTVYFGGEFTKVGAVTRRRAAAVSATTGALTAFNPNADARVEAIESVGTSIYLGGEFLTLGTTPRSRVAKVTAATGAVDPTWAPTADAAVHDIVALPTKILIGGEFESVSGSPGVSQRGLASLHPTTGLLLPWANHPTFQLTSLKTWSGLLVAAGGGSGGHAVGYDLATGTQKWLAFSDGDANSTAVVNGVMYVGGHFTTWQGQPASHVVALDPSTGVRRNWAITVNSNLGVFAMDGFDGHLAIGGDFTKINRLARQRFARFTEVPDTTPPTAPGKPSAAVVDARTVDLTWPAATDNSATTLNYSVYRNGGYDPIGTVTTSANPVTFRDDTLDPGTEATYTVVADDGTQPGPASLPSDPVTTPTASATTMQSVRLLDIDADGRTDQLDVTFSDPVTCTAPCTTPWQLAGLPNGTNLTGVTLEGDVAHLHLSEGFGTRSTEVGSATIALTDLGGGVRGPDTTAVTFAAQPPTDGMGPIPIDLASANEATTAGLMEVGDTFTVTFSEPIDPDSVLPANVKLLDPSGIGSDGLIVVGLTDGPLDLGSDTYLLSDGGTVVYQDSTLTMLDGGRKIRSTIVGACTGTACGSESVGVESVVVYHPEPFLRDLAGNHAVGEHTESELLY